MNSKDSSGWIKISRDIEYHWIWQSPRQFQWWLQLLFLATWEEERIFQNGRIEVTLKRGQMAVSLRYLCRRFMCTKPTAIQFLRVLEHNGMIKRKKMNKFSIIEILNYDKYQAKNDEDLPEFSANSLPVEKVEVKNGTVRENKSSENQNSKEILPVETDSDDEKIAEKSSEILPLREPNPLPNSLPKERNKEINNIYTTSTAPARTHTREEGEKDFFNQMMNSELFFEQAQMTLDCHDPDLLKKIARKFYAYSCASENWHNSPGDFKKNFINWARYELKNLRNKISQNNGTSFSKETNTGQRENRRGSDVGEHKAEDFLPPFPS